MRKSLYIGCALLLLASACKKTGEVDHVNANTSFSDALSVSSSNVTLTAANDNDTVLAFTWPAVSYNTPVTVNYTLELDVPSDTSGAAPWAKATKFIAGINVLKYSFAGKDLNNLMQTLNYVSSTSLVFRVLSDVVQYNGSASSVPTISSSAVATVVTPYLSALYVPGAYQQWAPAVAPVINTVAGYAGIFEGYVYMPGSGTQDFKFTNAPDWDHINYGDGGSGLMSTDGTAPDLTVPNGGYYELSANLNNNTWTAKATTWGIIGDATPGGWNTDTQLTYDPINQVWTATVALIQAGSFKFRANNAWVIDFGIDGSGNLQYADNPLFTYNPSLNNLSVPADGTYLVTLDLHNSQHYTYSLVKQ